MKFISTKGMTNESAPEGKVLVQYLHPFFGGFTNEFAVGYFDNPNEYNDGSGEGWKLWHNSAPILVVGYYELPVAIETEVAELSQGDFLDKYGEKHPNYGSVGE